MVDAVVGVLLNKLLELLVREGQQLLEFDSQFDKLKDELGYMQGYIKEADRMRRNEGREILKLVTRDLRELVYGAEDVIADCYIEFMKQHDGYLLNIVSCCSPRLLKFRLKISRRLKKIIQRIEAVQGRMKSYLSAAPSTITSREKQSTTLLSYPILLEEADIVGLEDDASKVEKDPRITRALNRDWNSWMLIEMNVEEKSLRKKEVVELLKKLKEVLGDEKYLVVLDDVWGNERSWWESLKSAFPRNIGCRVIVTTRNEKVARTMGAMEKHIHRPKILSDDDSWSLFSKIAFAWNGGNCPNSVVAGLSKEIVARCKGLPLAIRVEAAEALLAQLQVLKAGEKEMKRRRKEEKGAMKAAEMKAMGDCNNSSSSSSESSNSECGEVVDMSCLRSGALAQDKNKIDQPQPKRLELKGQLWVVSAWASAEMGLIPNSTMASQSAQSIHDFTVKDARGNDVDFSTYKGKVLLIVNVASKCGLTNSNYTELAQLYGKYKNQGFEILAFPCNQFGEEEPGTNEEILETACTRFKAEYPIFDKIDVNGDNAVPVYKFLKSSKGGLFGDSIKWNFTKFLVDKDGHVVDRYAPTTSLSIEKDIKKLLGVN
ncbi:hypothetical protein AAC387_Pa11g0322 [Persea americana]